MEATLPACPSCGAHIEATLRRPKVNVTRAAEMAGVCQRTVWNWVQANKVEWCRTPSGRGVRIYVDTLVRAPRG